MIGILTEKPSASRNFAKAFGGMKGQYKGQDYMILAARGSLYQFDPKPSNQVPKNLESHYKSWDVSKLPWDEKDFLWKRVPQKGTSPLLKSLQRDLRKCDEIIIATDIDPSGEGQLIAWSILDELGVRNKKCTRMNFTDESDPKALLKAFDTREILPPMEEDPEYRKALYRTKWDYLSMQFTRIASSFVPGGICLRQGRLKSYMVYVVGKQLDAINSYQKIPSYQNRFRDENGVVYTNKDEDVFSKKEMVPQKYTDSPVVVDKKTKKRTSPPKLIDLSTLSSKLSPKGFRADVVLNTYQKMYEAGIVSYPRTEDKYITTEQFNELLPLVDKMCQVVGVSPHLLTHKTPRKTHIREKLTHGANRPGKNVPASLDALSKYGPGAKEIYEILAKNYLAILAEDYEYENQQGYLEKYPAFRGSVNVPLKLGYKEVFFDEDDVDEEEGKGLGSVAKPFVHEGFPPKPQAPTMKWLMKQLEKNNVGTGATRTSTYAVVTKAPSKYNKYPLLQDRRGKIAMTEYGEMSYHLLPDTHIGSMDITKKLNDEMKAISEGKKDPEELLRKVQQLVLDDLKTMAKNAKTMRKELNVEMADYKDVERFEVEFNGKKANVKRVQRGYRLTDEEVKALRDGKKVRCTFTSKAGKPYTMVGGLAEMEYNGHKYVGIDFKFPEEVPNSFCGHQFTQDEKDALEEGSELFIEGLVSKRGNTFDAYVSYGETDYGKKGINLRFE